MKISTRLSLAGLFSVGVVAVIGTMLLFATQQVRRELTKNETAGEIFNAVNAVRYLTLEYVLRHEDRVQTQWQLKHASLSKLLASTTEFTGSQEQVIMDELRYTHDKHRQPLPPAHHEPPGAPKQERQRRGARGTGEQADRANHEQDTNHAFQRTEPGPPKPGGGPGSSTPGKRRGHGVRRHCSLCHRVDVVSDS